MVLPTSDITPRAGMKGKAVHIIHVYEDFLWAMGDKSEPPELQNVSDDDDEYEEDEAEETVKSDDLPPVTTEESKVPEPKDENAESTPVKQLSTEGKA